MAEGTVQSIEIDASPEAVFAVAVDLENYPTWASGVAAFQVLERDGQGRPHRAHMELEGFVKAVRFDLTYDYDEPQRMSWVADPGEDLEFLEGSYSFTERNGITEVVYALRAKPKFPIPGFIRRQVEKQIVTTALRGLRDQVESG